jgi:hypothetical protein
MTSATPDSDPHVNPALVTRRQLDQKLASLLRGIAALARLAEENEVARAHLYRVLTFCQITVHSDLSRTIEAPGPEVPQIPPAK